jgi:hypothetical protein
MSRVVVVPIAVMAMAVFQRPDRQSLIRHR